MSDIDRRGGDRPLAKPADVPDWGREVRSRLSSVRLSPEREAEIVDELAQHLDDRWRELIAGGRSAVEAERLTLAEFGAGGRLASYLTPLRQAQVTPPPVPGMSIGRLWGDLRQDLRYTLRTIAASPGFAAVAILSLALGIGANTAIFSLWNGVLRAPLPGVREPEQLAILSNPDESGSWSGRMSGPRSWLTYSEFEDQRDHAEGFSAVMASQSGQNTWPISLDGGPLEEASGRLVSGGFFEVLGARPAIGRLFAAADDRSDAPTAVISYAYWQRRFGGRAGVIGTTLTIRHVPITIIGVAARGFVGETSSQQPDVWLPLRLQPSVLPGPDRLHDTPPEKRMWLHVFARLKPGVTLTQANAEANAIFHAGLESFYGAAAAGPRRREFLDQRLEVRSGARGASRTRREFSQSLTAMLAAVGVLLLIACANLANLLLARGAARQPEMALRLSLGARAERLGRQLATESLTLAAGGCAAAIPVAFALHAALVEMIAQSDRRFHMDFALDPMVLTFLIASTVVAALLFGALPAWQATRTPAAQALKDQHRGAIGSMRQLRSGKLLVSVQLALSLPLLVGAGLLARTVYNLQRADLGFPARQLLLVRVDLREAGYEEEERRDQLLQQLVSEIRRLPGVQAISFSELGLFSGGESSATVAIDGYVPKRDEDRDSAMDNVGPRYFSTLGIPMRLGRDVVESDRDGGAAVCMINEAFARQFFDRRNPVGSRVTLVNEDEGRRSYQIVGVAGDAHTSGLRGAVEPRFFVASQRSSGTMSPTLLIRTAMESGPILPTIRKAIQAIDPKLPIVASTSIEDQMAPLTAQDRAAAKLAVVFGSVALTLAAIGLYGVLSYGVARRTAEIAIRIALGSRPGRVVAMILRETVALVSVGLALGAALAYVALRLIDSRLYGVAPQDPLTLALALGLLLIVALGAAFLPAIRASRVDPMVALRHS